MEKKAQKEINNRKVFEYYFDVVRPHRRLVMLTFAVVVVGAILPIVTPLYYKEFFDILAGATPGPRSFQELLRPILIVLGLEIFAFILWRIQDFSINFLETKAMKDLKTSSFHKLLGHSHAFFTDNFVGSLVQKVSRYSRAFERIADRLIFDIIPIVIKFCGILIALYFVNTSIFLLIVGYITLFLLSQFIFSHWKLPYDVRIAEQDSKVTGALADALTNHTTIQSFATAGFEEKNFHDVTEKQRSLTLWSWWMDGLLRTFHNIIGVAVEILFFVIGIIAWQKGAFTVGSFVLVQTYIIQMNSNLWNMGRIFRDVYATIADAKEMIDILELPREIDDKEGARSLAVTKGEISFDRVSYGYRDGRRIFEDFSLAILPGERVALVGPSGAGKSTFVKLLLRLADVSEGSISIDSKDVREVSQDSLHKKIAYVPQDTMLFHRTLLENIRYGRLSANDADVKEAARLAHCEEFIKQLPHGYDTLVGERGIKLSGGERQRVAIARALLKNAPVLVLDEATSSLDSHSESLIQDALDVLMKGRTTIVIAHRLSTIRKMDRIIVMREGKIVEEGSHEELLKKRTGLYKKLWKLQAGGFLAST